MAPSDIEQIRAATQTVYEQNAAAWDRQRPKSLYEKSWLDRFAALVTGDRRLLDLGCGTGDPVAGYFLSLSFDVVGVDYSETMIALAKKRFPQAEWHLQDIRGLNLAGTFSGV